MDRRTFIASTAAALAAGGLAGRARAAEDLKVGVLIPHSGPSGLFGPSGENCATLAVEEINAAGGILGRRIQPIFADVGGPPADAVQAAQRLWRGEGAEAFIGMHDSAVRSALTGVFKGQVPYIYTPVNEGGVCPPGTYILGETPPQQLQPVIPWLARERGAESWYLIGNDYNWPRDTNAAAKTYIESAGGTVVGEEYLPFTADNFDSNLVRIRESGANAVLITLVGGASVSFNRAFADFGLAESALRLGTLIEENTLAGIGAESAEGLFASAGYFASVETPAARAFADAYAERFGADAAQLNTLGQSVYEGLRLLHALAEKTGSLDAAAMDEAADGASYEGPRGTVTLKDRYVSQDIYLAQAKGASFEVVESFEDVAPGDYCG